MIHARFPRLSPSLGLGRQRTGRRCTLASREPIHFERSQRLTSAPSARKHSPIHRLRPWSRSHLISRQIVGFDAARKMSSAKAASLPHLYALRADCLQRCHGSGASIPLKRIRASPMSIVSPSITDARPVTCSPAIALAPKSAIRIATTPIQGFNRGLS